MIDLSNEALDALEAQPESVGMLAFHLRNMADGSVDAIDAERLSRAATLVSVITALRDREAAIVAAAFEAAAYAVTEADRACLGARGARAAIRALTPSDATAALEAIKRAERNKARREAAAIAGDTDGYRYPTVQAAILATIEPEGGV